MTGTLWSVTAIKSAGKLTKGMTVEILVTGTTARHCGYGNFEIVKLS